MSTPFRSIPNASALRDIVVGVDTDPANARNRLGVGARESKELEQQIFNRDRSAIPGAVRMSFGIYNTKEEVDVLCEALAAAAAGKHLDGYQLDRERGEYIREDMTDRFESVLQL